MDVHKLNTQTFLGSSMLSDACSCLITNWSSVAGSARTLRGALTAELAHNWLVMQENGYSHRKKRMISRYLTGNILQPNRARYPRPTRTLYISRAGVGQLSYRNVYANVINYKVITSGEAKPSNFPLLFIKPCSK